ncbi:hypothetical protein GCM10009557_01280 [Virgisporangium ochraceum]|uniref:DUF2637 domain-containing protein n=1 Tax=Virgisporangium ochraceum TaxID=65505 RepID=A0A8J4A1M1_9ACTN|nr:DUF2637 domain-containing protein [Virgisporangium ochraceum]GIJ74159.1 hypothetical protein Voc01_090760 [Virgisporangium ochraceum]
MTAVAEQNANGRRAPELNSVESGQRADTATAPDRRAAGADLTQLRRVQWAVRATLALGVAASVCANVLHARDELISQTIAAWPPLALLLTVELISRVPVYRRSLAVIRILATVAIAGIAAYVSYWHMAAVAARYGENGVAPYLLPLSVDGLIVVASVSLVELAGRIRDADAQPQPESIIAMVGLGSAATTFTPIEKPPGAEPFQTPRNQTRSSNLPEAGQFGETGVGIVESPINSTPVTSGSETRPAQTNGNDNPAVAADFVLLLPAARTAHETLRRQGRSLSRDALAMQLRADGYTIATGKVSALLNLLRTDQTGGRASGSDPASPHQ